MRKTFRYRIYPNKTTEIKALETLNLCRILYNLALEQRRDAWKYHRKPVSCYDQINQLPELKKAFPEFKQVPAQVLQDVIKRVNETYRAFFRRVKNGEKSGYPRFKGYNRYHSFALTQNSWKLENNRLNIYRIGRFKIKLHRSIEGSIKTVTIKRSPSGKWFVSFSCDNVPVKPLPKTGKAIGIDVGLESFATLSSGKKIPNPRWFKQLGGILAARQQSLSRKKKRSNRRNKARILVAKTWEKIQNQRRGFHFKVAKQLLKEFDTIYVEDMPAWNGWRSLNKSMRDAAWFKFFEILQFKAEEAGRQVIKVPAKKTSQICSRCGTEVPKKLSDRTHVCPQCGLVIDSDHNGAINILRLGASLRGSDIPFPEKSINR